MERRFEVRLGELLADAEVNPEVFAGMLARIERFVEPFAAALVRCEQRRHVAEYVAGLLSNVDRKNAESIAYLHDQRRQALQKFVGQVAWDHRPLVAELARQVGREIGEGEGVLVIDPSSFPKKGAHSVGVDRQWCGRLGKVDNCQVGVFLAYASRAEHALVNFRLYLPKSWTKDRARRKRCGVPKELRFHTRHELALAMLDETAAELPHGWIAGDDELGKNAGFRGQLRARGEHYVLAVPRNTLVRAVHAAPPEYAGFGRPPQVPFTRVDRWCAALAEDAWTTIDVRDAEQGPLVVEAVMTRVRAKNERRQVGNEEMLLVLRERQGNGAWKHDYFLCHGLRETPLAELVRVAKTRQRVEECFQRAKSEAGLADYEVRTWQGWHHHILLSLLATWFLTLEARREKKVRPRDDRSSNPTNDCPLAA
jgi:SRSO17 transposase